MEPGLRRAAMNTKQVLTGIFGLMFCATAALGTPTVVYNGTEAGCDGPRKYTYNVESKDSPIMEFQVSTGDLDIHHYMNILMPEGWNFAVGMLGDGLSCYGTCSEIGGRATLLKHLTDNCIVWSTDDPKLAITSFTFGFDHSWSARDAAWFLSDEKETTYEESCLDPVGLGTGPVHAPFTSPEPASLCLLLLAAPVFLRRK